MSDAVTKPVLLVKKADAKKGSLWNQLTNKRIIKQHGGFDIPEGDLHAIPKYENPVYQQQETSEATNAMLSDLEKEIQQLKEKDKSSSVFNHPSYNSLPPHDSDKHINDDL
ncbi:MAG TPA: hypothetical protein VNW29_01290 [Candidatus Sulfotelmatobacter sp.]|jgi:hypothetical protein|nr:hypothetical protein [Candidatus Sulfotelmatobacter sp.]